MDIWLISATSASQKDEKDSDGVYIRRERYAGACSRSFYVGDDVKQEDIKARFEDGTLKLHVPKNKKEVVVENPNYIAIEGWGIFTRQTGDWYIKSGERQMK